MLRGRNQIGTGGTIFFVRTPQGEKLLVTQVHVVDVAGGQAPFLHRGFHYGPFFRPTKVEPDAFEFELPEAYKAPVWQDSELDLAIFRVPPGFEEVCRCSGLPIALPQEGPAHQIGYPILTRRNDSSIGRVTGELFGHVEQRVSVGKIWLNGEEWVGDMDALSGNSGGPTLNLSGEVVGIIHMLKTWKGEGYRYKVPSLSIYPIGFVLERAGFAD